MEKDGISKGKQREEIVPLLIHPLIALYNTTNRIESIHPADFGNGILKISKLHRTASFCSASTAKTPHRVKGYFPSTP